MVTRFIVMSNKRCSQAAGWKKLTLITRDNSILPLSCAFKGSKKVVSTFLYVGSVQTSRGLLQTRFSPIFLVNSYIVKKREISGLLITKMIGIIRKLIKNYI